MDGVAHQHQVRLLIIRLWGSCSREIHRIIVTRKRYLIGSNPITQKWEKFSTFFFLWIFDWSVGGWLRSSQSGLETGHPIMSGNSRERPVGEFTYMNPTDRKNPRHWKVGNGSMILMNYRRWTDRRRVEKESETGIKGLGAWFHEMTNILWRRCTPEINQYFSVYNSAVQSVTLTKWTSGVRIPVRRLQDCAIHGYFLLLPK